MKIGIGDLQSVQIVRSFRALRLGFWVCFILFLLLLTLLEGHFEGRYFGGGVKTTGGLIVGAAGCFISASIMFAIVFSSRIRKWVTHGERRHYYEPIHFIFVGIIFLFVGVGMLLSIGWYDAT